MTITFDNNICSQRKLYPTFSTQIISDIFVTENSTQLHGVYDTLNIHHPDLIDIYKGQVILTTLILFLCSCF